MAQRRDVLRWGLAGTLGIAAPGAAALISSRRPQVRPGLAGEHARPVDGEAGPPPGAFTAALAVPEVLRPISTDGGIDRYEIRQLEGRQRMRSDADTVVWGYQGTFPGPTIEARRGRRTTVTHYNELSVPTVVHLHGAVVAADHDGYPSDFVLPAGGDWATDPQVMAHAEHTVAGVTSGRRTHVYPNEQPSATLWYHDHRMDFSGPQVYRGLAGFYLIRDEIEDSLPLPRGARELPLMLADRSFNPDGSLFYPSRDASLHEPGVDLEYHHSGMLGDTITVNGVAWPYCEVDAALYRLRIVNASNARRYQLVLDPPPPAESSFIQIGSDVRLLPSPIRHSAILISPGERYDVLVDFSRYEPGTTVQLRNADGEGATTYIMRFDVARRAGDDARVPQTLAPEDGTEDELAVDPAAVADRSFSFFSGPEGTGLPPMINLQTFDPARIDARPALGTTEIWDITADPNHPVHLHLAHFKVLSRDGGPPDPQDTGWKDTVFVPQGGVRLAVRFAGYRGTYVFHCHNLEHGDSGMMAQMEIV